MTEMDFRQYDNALGRFNVIDPLAEMDYSGSPYAFGFNNPVYFSDPSGLRGRNLGRGILRFLFGWLTGDEYVGYSNDYGGGRSDYDEGTRAQAEANVNALSVWALTVQSEFNRGGGGSGGGSGGFGGGGLGGFQGGGGIGQPRKDRWDNRDGYITYPEAYYTYKLGKGQTDLYAKLDMLDLSKVHVSDFKDGVGSTIVVNFASSKYYTNPTQALVFGSITLQLMENNMVFAPIMDKYNFDLKLTKDSKLRDFLTLMGAQLNGGGTPFWIMINGSAKIKN